MTMTETDGESTYELHVNGKLIGKFQNPVAKADYEKVTKVFPEGRAAGRQQDSDRIRCCLERAESGRATALRSRAVAGRESRLPSPARSKRPLPNRPIEKPAIPAFAFNYDPTNAKKVHRQTDGIVCVEAEDYDAVDREVAGNGI